MENATYQVPALENGLRRPAIRCGLQDKTLQGKKLVLEDAIAFLNQVEREVASTSTTVDILSVAGIVAWSAVITTDIIRNAVKVTPTGNAKILTSVLDEVHKQASKRKFDGNRYGKEIKKVDELVKALRHRVPKHSHGLVDVFGELAKNSIAMMGFAADAKDTKASVEQSRKNALNQLNKLKESLKKLDEKIAYEAQSDDEGASKSPRENMSQPKQKNISLGALR